MNIAKINYNCIENGPGIRHSVFVSGCPFRCKGCHNQEAWDYSYGEEYTLPLEKAFLDKCDVPYMKGITVLGGEPLCPENYDTVLSLVKAFKNRFPEKTVWVYTGYLYEDLADKEIMDYIDVLVDGPFVLDKRDLRLKFRGSSNQRIIDIKKTRESGETCLLDL